MLEEDKAARMEVMFKPAPGHDVLEQVLRCRRRVSLSRMRADRSVAWGSCPNGGCVSPSNCRVSRISAGVISF